MISSIGSNHSVQQQHFTQKQSPHVRTCF